MACKWSNLDKHYIEQANFNIFSDTKHHSGDNFNNVVIIYKAHNLLLNFAVNPKAATCSELIRYLNINSTYERIKIVTQDWGA